MTAPAAGAVRRSRWEGIPVVAAWVVGLALVSLAAVFVGNGNLVVAIVPIALAVLAAVVWRMPAHDALPGLAFLCLVLENPSEAFGSGVWRSPIYVVGALFLQKMNSTLPIRPLVFSGLDVSLAFLMAALVARRIRREPPDPAYVRSPVIVTQVALGCLATIAVVWVFGIARGGSVGNSVWQVFRVIYLPAALLLFSAGLRGPADIPRLGRVLVAAALYRAVIAIWIRLQFPDVEAVPFTTIHADSMLFSDAIVLVVANLVVRPSARALRTAALVVPVVAWGIVANHRRLAWVELLVALVVVVVLAPWTRVKRRVVQALVASAPVLVLYVAVGWGHPTGVFAPVKTIRSVVDSKSDGSTAWRDWENYNIAYTLRRNPILGTGFGHEYEEVVLLPDISIWYPLYRLAPHNSVLGLLAYAGVIGFMGIWMLVPIGVLLAYRAQRWAVDPVQRVAGLTVIGALTAYVLHCYGDMGLGTWASVFIVAPAIALAGKIAVANGGWRAATATARAAARDLVRREP